MINSRISIIAAIDRNNLIGRNNRMPWQIPEDLRYFRAKTLGHSVIMGKNTWLSLGRTLDQRVNIILTRDRELTVPGAVICHGLADCLDHCGGNECFVIGGGQVFRLFMPLAAKLYITRIDAEFEGDTHFPQIEPDDWELVYFESKMSVAGYNLAFTEYLRRNPKAVPPDQAVRVAGPSAIQTPVS